jgi:hypothetical protein
MFSKKLPPYLLGKYQLIGTVTFSVLFAIVFLNLYIPFSDTAWFGLGNSETFENTVVFIMSSIGMLIVSRMLMYRANKLREMTYFEYVVWGILEIIFICAIYTKMTINIFHPVNHTWTDIFSHTLPYCAIALCIPYFMTGMYFAIIDKNKTIRLLNYEQVVTDEAPKQEAQLQKITLYDNSGTLKMSINVDNLYYIESDDNYIKVWYTNSQGELQQYQLRCRLKTVEDSFKSSKLLRCNRKYIVNMDKVCNFRKESSGYVLELINKAIPEIPVTKSYNDAILAYFTDSSPLMEPIGEE